VDNVSPKTTNENSTSHSHNKKRSRPAMTLRRTLEDVSSGDESPASRWHQASPESKVTSSDDLPSVYHQDVDADDNDGWIGSSQELQNAAEEYRSVMTMLRNKEQPNKVSSLLLCRVGLCWVLWTRYFYQGLLTLLAP
jgi:hypothetical protein